MNDTFVLRLEFGSRWFDAVCGRFFDLGLRGLEVISEEPRAVVRTYCDSADSAETYANGMEAYLKELALLWPEDPDYSIEVSRLENVDWANEWKKHFKPAVAAPGIVVRPSWEPYDPLPGERVVVIDPKMAFGTGTHETTRMALAALVDWFSDGGRGVTRVLDAGCGTGVLAIVALLLGATEAVAVDNDPVAVDCARENAALNDVADRMLAVATPLADIEGVFERVVANIDAPTLAVLAAGIVGRLAEGGRLAVTGLLEAGAAEVAPRFLALGLREVGRRSQGEWVLIEFEKPR